MITNNLPGSKFIHEPRTHVINEVIWRWPRFIYYDNSIIKYRNPRSHFSLSKDLFSRVSTYRHLTRWQVAPHEANRQTSTPKVLQNTKQLVLITLYLYSAS